MLRDQYAPVDLFALVPALAVEFEPVLARLDTLLDDDVLFRAVRDDLARRYPRTRETGRPSPPVEVLLRMLMVRRLYGWSYAETVSGSQMSSSRHAARREYSWIRLPSRSRRTIAPDAWTGCGRPSGGRRSSERCGRARL